MSHAIDGLRCRKLMYATLRTADEPANGFLPDIYCRLVLLHTTAVMLCQTRRFSAATYNSVLQKKECFQQSKALV